MQAADCKNGNLVVIVLTFNSASTIAAVISSVKAFASRIVVVDSFSRDDTVAISKSHDAEVVQHQFENYSVQRNFAQSYASLDPGDWVLHLDSDEVVSPELAQNIQTALLGASDNVDGYLIRRLSYFLGHPIRYGHTNPSWHLRMFRAGKGRCEDRLYDQHFITQGNVRKLEGLLLDLQATTIEGWTASHNRWSSAEAEQLINTAAKDENSSDATLPARLSGDLRMKKRWLKNNIYYKSPLLLRAFVFFIYSYVIKLGFLDGMPGLIYHTLQAFWFRFLVDSKVIESRLKLANKSSKNALTDIRY